MKILVVDDNDRKIDKIKEVIDQYSSIFVDDIHVVMDLCNAKIELRRTFYDLMILDIQIPNKSGEDPIKDGGISLLKEINDRDIYKKPQCIIGLTAYDETIKTGLGVFDNYLWNIIQYNERKREWIEKLEKKIDYLLNLEKYRTNKPDDAYQYNLGVLAALPMPEFKSLFDVFTFSEIEMEGEPAKYYKAVVTEKKDENTVVGVCSFQPGIPAAAISTLKLIHYFRPEYLALVGITGGVESEVNIGDVLVADPSWDWGSGKRKKTDNGGILDPEPQQERLDPFLLSIFHDIQCNDDIFLDIWKKWRGDKPETPPRLIIGPCVSGSCVVADKDVVDEIKKSNRKLIGIEMETYGFMLAAKNSFKPIPKAFSIKSVCDYADSTKNDKYHDYAAYVSSSFLRILFMTYF